MSSQFYRRRLWAGLVFSSAGLVAWSWFSSSWSEEPNLASLSAEEIALNKDQIASRLGDALKSNSFPDSIELEVDGEPTTASVEYSLDFEAHERMQKLMRAWKPDHGAFVAMDASSGRVLSMISYSREHDEHGNLALKASFPAASIFKVVTASAALDLNKANPNTIVPFNGANHTLYKKNVQETKANRWTRRMTLREAFGRSVNVFFGKLGLFYVGPHDLIEYAERFRFNQRIHADFPVQMGQVHISPDDPWSVVTAASGFTRDNTMSPIHGAMIAAAVANDGVMMEPYLVEALTDDKGMMIYQAEPKQASIAVGPRSAAELRVLMRETIRSGTSRRSFRQMVGRDDFDDVEFGGKTGSLTGGDPMGKCDWFVGYMLYKDQRIAVAVLTVNEQKWRVKSSYLASEFFLNYARGIKSRERATAALDLRRARDVN